MTWSIESGTENRIRGSYRIGKFVFKKCWVPFRTGFWFYKMFLRLWEKLVVVKEEGVIWGFAFFHSTFHCITIAGGIHPKKRCRVFWCLCCSKFTSCLIMMESPFLASRCFFLSKRQCSFFSTAPFLKSIDWSGQSELCMSLSVPMKMQQKTFLRKALCGWLLEMFYDDKRWLGEFLGGFTMETCWDIPSKILLERSLWEVEGIFGTSLLNRKHSLVIRWYRNGGFAKLRIWTLVKSILILWEVNFRRRGILWF